MKPTGKLIFITLEAVKEVKTGFKKSATPVPTKPTIAIIQKVGEDVSKYKTGDRVYIGAFYSDPQIVDGEEVIIIDESKILARD